MPAADLPIAASFWEDHRNEITAVATVLLAVGFAKLVDSAIAKRGGRLRAAVGVEELSPEAGTRLRLVRRLVFAVIIVIGFALALSQFESIKRLATGILASSAVLGLVVGFAARQVLANGVAGILLAITQPIRIGDLVTFEEETGVVEDVRLSYTYVRAGDGRRIIIPNERLAQSTIENHTIVDPRVHVEVSLWVPVDADVQRTLAVLREEGEGVEVDVAEVDKEGIRLVAGTWAQSASERGKAEAGLRARCLERLQRASILGSRSPGG
jgi:small-conductance mechanosensitive channel